MYIGIGRLRALSVRRTLRGRGKTRYCFYYMYKSGFGQHSMHWYGMCCITSPLHDFFRAPADFAPSKRVEHSRFPFRER